MNSRQLRAVAVGAAVGACVGGVYALVLVSYRDMLARQQAIARGEVPEKDCGCKDKEATVATSPELADAERTTQTQFTITAERARDIRREHPEMKWTDAMHQAAQERNGGNPSPEAEVQDESAG